ncbi:MAG TPA: rRNA maturation RNase YbeY [Candidatus Lustribacter sp.]
MYFANRTRGTGLRAAALRATLERLLDALDARESTVSLSLVRDAEMRELNREHRHKDAATDVLSFPLYEPAAFERGGRTRPRAAAASERMLGDIVISVDTAQAQAAAYDAPLAREVERLLIHGVLHLCGHDHEAAGERRAMEREERRLAEAIGMPWPYLGDLGGDLG